MSSMSFFVDGLLKNQFHLLHLLFGFILETSKKKKTSSSNPNQQTLKTKD